MDCHSDLTPQRVVYSNGSYVVWAWTDKRSRLRISFAVVLGTTGWKALLGNTAQLIRVVLISMLQFGRDALEQLSLLVGPR
jgi:hypothetical protein